mmetsp:Transcript_10244/g.16708  ORF Transcript_10244/g.16708 Transcript_10244/m.16708 type:complete len:397 (+) Transcript_10244:51-1241(+)
MAATSNGSCLKPQEEEWREVFNRLTERFPSVPGKRIAQILRENNGHAGEAARALRDMTGSHVKEHDADDIEHVRTLLSSPVMFKHACKEKFKRFDANGDGVLEFDEIKDLTTALYDEFGLEVPPEGTLRAFFYATDENQDGVLSEREFRKFFEMFLRYSFFDHLKLREVVKTGQAIEARRNSTKPLNRQTTDVWDLTADEKESVASNGEGNVAPACEAVTNAKGRRTSNENLQPRRRERQRDDGQREERHRSRNNPEQAVRCLAPNGVAYRSSAAFQDKRSVAVNKGDIVPVLEHWVRTPDGWLPMIDPHGHALFELSSTGYCQSDMVVRSASQSPQNARNSNANRAIGRLPCEEWKPVFERLCERFPNLSSEKVIQALTENEGHAGKAASMLRQM